MIHHLRRAFTLALPTLMSMTAVAQNLDLADGIHYEVSAETVFSNDATPLWMGANKYGISGISSDYGYLRAALNRTTDTDSLRKWRFGYGADVVAGYGLTGANFIPAQLYGEVQYRALRLTAGIKEQPAEFKNNRLSSGSMTLGSNARPVPQVRLSLPEYLSITGRSNWAAIKGHISYGMMTDGKWQENYVTDGIHYAKKVLYHSKAGYLRIGNEDKFPLVFEGGLEMACQFGGDIYNALGREDICSEVLHGGTGVKDFLDALLGTGSDATDGDYANVAGNALGSWLFSLSYKGKDWKARVYYDHYFEDHSMMFFEYGWRDGLIGAEITLPHNRICDDIVYEYLYTKYQSGPIYHDHNTVIADQISGSDNYYNHNLYAGWQHWGQGIGNPLIASPLYAHNGKLTFNANRIKAHHLGLSGSPTAEWNYRLLASFIQSWGTYAQPFENIRRSSSLLCEVGYRPDFRGHRAIAKGWQFTAAWAMDRGALLGDNNGFSLKVSYSR